MLLLLVLCQTHQSLFYSVKQFDSGDFSNLKFYTIPKGYDDLSKYINTLFTTGDNNRKMIETAYSKNLNKDDYYKSYISVVEDKEDKDHLGLYTVIKADEGVQIFTYSLSPSDFSKGKGKNKEIVVDLGLVQLTYSTSKSDGYEKVDIKLEDNDHLPQIDEIIKYIKDNTGNEVKPSSIEGNKFTHYGDSTLTYGKFVQDVLKNTVGKGSDLVVNKYHYDLVFKLEGKVIDVNFEDIKDKVISYDKKGKIAFKSMGFDSIVIVNRDELDTETTSQKFFKYLFFYAASMAFSTSLYALSLSLSP